MLGRAVPKDYTENKKVLLNTFFIKISRFVAMFKIFRKELMYQSYVNLFPTVNCLLEYDFCCLVTYISVAVFVNFTNVKLKASYIVLAMSFYTRLCCNLGFFLSRAIITTIGGLISIQRYQVKKFYI